MWGLIHSKKKSDVQSGSQLADVLMQSDDIDANAKKDLVYFQCVAMHKLGRYVDAKRQLEEFLEVLSWLTFLSAAVLLLSPCHHLTHTINSLQQCKGY